MEHLYSISAYDFDTDEYGGISEALSGIGRSGADGIELLTGYFEPDAAFDGITKGVHLPYATDWYSPWTGDTGYIDRVSPENIRYRSYGRSKEEMIDTVRSAVLYASSLSPAYGVFHASNTRMEEVMSFSHRDSDEDVLMAVTELLNGVARTFPGGEPPFRILLENLWWPGLTLMDDSGYRSLERELEFGNWGICLDTGHLMNRLGHCREEGESIRDVLRIVRSYPRAMKERIGTIHLHMSLSADYRERCMKECTNFEMTDDDEAMDKAYKHVCSIDQHRPFTDRMCTDIVNILGPDHVTHEIYSPDPQGRLSGFAMQRSLFRP